MNIEHALLGTFVYLAAAVISAPIATRLGLGSVLGYLIAGIVIGPSVLNLLGSGTGDIMHFAELGVIVMLFLVGLELQPSKLWQLRRAILGLGGMQVAGTALVIGIAAALLGLDWRAALAAGLILAMSSTAIVLQSLNERGLMKTSAGQSCFAVLLFQDISVIPILALLPLIATSAAHTEGHGISLIADFPAWAQAAATIGAVALIILAGRYLMRPLFRFVATSGIREIFVGLALLIVVSITLLMQFVGLSAALGTFLGGVVLAESEYRHELEMDLDPFKGLLLAVFFIAVGAGIDFSLLAGQPVALIALVFGFVLLKLAVLFILSRGFGMAGPDGARFSFALAQGGEFAFVLISFAAGLGLLAGNQAGLLVAMVAMSMALAPLLMIFDERIVQPRFQKAGKTGAADLIDDTAKVVIAGHGRYGMTVSRLLNASGIKSVVLDHDAEQIDALRQFGFKVYYGDATRTDLLEAAGAHDAKVLVIAIDDREKTMELVHTAHQHFPNLQVIARAHDRTHAYELMNAGVAHVHREVFASSVDMAENVMTVLGRHPFEAFRAARTFKAHDERLLRETAHHAGDRQKLIDAARTSRAEISRVLSGDKSEQGHATDHAWEAPDRTRE